METISLSPRRLTLTGVSKATVSQWRGVWGAALRDLSPAAYDAVYAGRDLQGRARPPYTLRNLSETRSSESARHQLVWTLIGQEALAHEETFLRAWALAGDRGVGPRGKRVDFRVVAGTVLGPDGHPLPSGERAWPLSRAQWPLPGDPEHTPCRLQFRAGLHIRHNNKFLGNPTWPEVLFAMCKRVKHWLPDDANSDLAQSWSAWEADARLRSGEWESREIVSYEQYSATQERVRVYHAVAGDIVFPHGPGPAWPLILATHLLHFGKHATEGLGHVGISPLS
jgi:hypothetical protein